MILSERYTEEIIARGNELAAATTYDSKSYIISTIEDAMENEQFIKDHPGVEGLLSEISLAEAYMREATILANKFILTVEAIERGEGYAESLLAAYIALRGVDTTAKGAGAASKELITRIDAHNRDAREINAVFG